MNINDISKKMLNVYKIFVGISCFLFIMLIAITDASISYHQEIKNYNENGYGDMAEEPDSGGIVDDYKITLSPSSVTLKVNETKKISSSITGTPQGEIVSGRWSSTNSSVATVDDSGNVTAKSVGTATIKATITTTVKTYEATCSIVVVEPFLYTVSVNPVTIEIGKSITVTPKVTPLDGGVITSQSFKYDSDDGSIATVTNNGTITAVSSGVVDIYVTSVVNGNEKITSFTVTVTNKTTTDDYKIVLNPTELTIQVAEMKRIISTITGTPQGELVSAKWSSDDPTIATVDDYGNVSGQKEGNTIVRATIKTTVKTYEATCSVVVIKTDYTGYKISASNKVKLYLANSGDGGTQTVTITKPNGSTDASLELDITSVNGYTETVISSINTGAQVYTLYTKSKNTKGDVNDTIKVCIKGTDICDTYQAYIYCKKWTEITGIKTFTPGYTMAEAHNKETCYYIDKSTNCEPNKDKDGNVISYTCTKYYNRCCGTSGGETLTYACYKNSAGTDYKWATSAPVGYTKVEDITTENNCKVPEKPVTYACYKNSTGTDYKWATSAPVGYIKVEDITTENNCKVPEKPACYKDKNDNYFFGLYANNSDYTLVPDIKEEKYCGVEIEVPSTAESISTLIYILVAISLGFGTWTIFYLYHKNKVS